MLALSLRRRGARALGSSALLPVVTLTAAATRRLQDLARRPGRDAAVLRVAVHEGGCRGLEYKFTLEELAAAAAAPAAVAAAAAAPRGGWEDDAGDVLIDQGGGARIVLDTVTVEKMRGSVIDYVSSLQGEMFAVVANPLAATACGCGTSFQPKDEPLAPAAPALA